MKESFPVVKQEKKNSDDEIIDIASVGGEYDAEKVQKEAENFVLQRLESFELSDVLIDKTDATLEKFVLPLKLYILLKTEFAFDKNGHNAEVAAKMLYELEHGDGETKFGMGGRGYMRFQDLKMKFNMQQEMERRSIITPDYSNTAS